MALLTKEQIQKADDLARELVSCPKWGKDGQVYVHEVNGDEYDAFERAITTDGTKRDVPHVRARLAILTVRNANGKPLFAGSDAAWLGRKGASTLNRIMTVAMRLNGLRTEDIEELAGNSSDSQGDDLPSG